MAPWELVEELVELVGEVEELVELLEEMYWSLPKFGTERIQFGAGYRIEIAQSWKGEAVGTVAVGIRKRQFVSGIAVGIAVVALEWAGTVVEEAGIVAGTALVEVSGTEAVEVSGTAPAEFEEAGIALPAVAGTAPAEVAETVQAGLAAAEVV